MEFLRMSVAASDGEAMRRQVMGEDYVDLAMGSADCFSKPLQEFLNEHAWGGTWLRSGLPLKTRSLCTCAMLAALGKTAELKGHIQGAVRNGATVVEIQEVLLHSAVYAGAPAAVAAFRSASEVLKELSFDILK
jgi:4-carboxymuconolactone decarboxylase